MLAFLALFIVILGHLSAVEELAPVYGRASSGVNFGDAAGEYTVLHIAPYCRYNTAVPKRLAELCLGVRKLPGGEMRHEMVMVAVDSGSGDIAGRVCLWSLPK